MISIYYLKGFKQAAQPGVFTHLSPTSTGIKFFNHYRESRVTTSKQVQFTVDKELLIPIDEICQKTMGTFDVIAWIRSLWENTLIETFGGNPVYVQEGVLSGPTGHIILSVWGDMMELLKKIICIVLPRFHCRAISKKTDSIKNASGKSS